MAFHLPSCQPLPPPPDSGKELLEVAASALQPTQLCIGLAEVRRRRADFTRQSAKERRAYLRGKPVPLVRSASGDLWMLDRHHRLGGLIAVDPDATTFGYVVLQLESSDRLEILQALKERGWLYLHDARGRGPLPPETLPTGLADLQDDPYRSLVWALKQEKRIAAAPLIPFHEFRWGAWLRSRSLPPFDSLHLEPALPAARALVRSTAASHLAGWQNEPPS